MHVRVGHIYLGAKYHLTFFYFTVVHLFEKSQTFFYRTVTVRTFYSGLCRSTFLGGNFLRSLFVNISLAFFNKANGKVPQLLEVVGSIIFVSPLISQPLNVFLYCFYIFYIFLGRVCIVEAQVAYTSIFLGDTEVHADGLSVAYM